jgi:hypothetical protein
VVQGAARAVGLAGLADAAAVEDEEVREEGPFSFGHYSQEVALYLFGVALARQTEPARDTPDVGVHDHALVDAEGVAEDHVGGLAAYAGEPDELGHGTRNLSSMVLNEYASHVPYGAGLVAEETCGSDLFLQAAEVGLCVVFRGAVLLEQPLRDLVDPDVGTLGGEDRRHQKLKRVLPFEIGPCVGVLLLETRYHLAYRGGGTLGVVRRRSHDGRGLYRGHQMGTPAWATGTFAQMPMGPISY